MSELAVKFHDARENERARWQIAHRLKLRIYSAFGAYSLSRFRYYSAGKYVADLVQASYAASRYCQLVEQGLVDRRHREVAEVVTPGEGIVFADKWLGKETPDHQLVDQIMCERASA